MLLHIIVIHYPHLSYTLSPEIKDPENRACLVTIILETAHAVPRSIAEIRGEY